MIVNIIFAGFLSAIVILPFVGLTIVALKQEKEIKNLNVLLFVKGEEIERLTNTLNEIKSITREDVDEIVEKNKTLEFQVNDLRQLREMDREARQRLSKENDKLYDLLNNFKMDENIERIHSLVKLYLDSMGDKVRKLNSEKEEKNEF